MLFQGIYKICRYCEFILVTSSLNNATWQTTTTPQWLQQHTFIFVCRWAGQFWPELVSVGSLVHLKPAVGTVASFTHLGVALLVSGALTGVTELPELSPTCSVILQQAPQACSQGDGGFWVRARWGHGPLRLRIGPTIIPFPRAKTITGLALIQGVGNRQVVVNGRSYTFTLQRIWKQR